MKKILNNMQVKWVFVISLVVISFFSCQKHYDPNFTVPRQFKPGDITIAATETKATLSWAASLFSPFATSYTIQIARDSTFASNVVDKIVTSTSAVVTDTVLQVRQFYVARIKANATGTTAESGWVISGK